jgi:hypothetical protein
MNTGPGDTGPETHEAAGPVAPGLSHHAPLRLDSDTSQYARALVTLLEPVTRDRHAAARLLALSPLARGRLKCSSCNGLASPVACTRAKVCSAA